LLNAGPPPNSTLATSNRRLAAKSSGVPWPHLFKYIDVASFAHTPTLHGKARCSGALLYSLEAATGMGYRKE
jgi:hypothetical protein